LIEQGQQDAALDYLRRDSRQVFRSTTDAIAQRIESSAQVAKEIESLIQNSATRVTTGTHVVADAGRTIQQVVDSVMRVNAMIERIALCAREQTDTLGEVSVAIGNLDGATQQNAALVVESAVAAQSLHDPATRLTQVLARFKV
jgi:methyl-accepting chemotaxis protein